MSARGSVQARPSMPQPAHAQRMRDAVARQLAQAAAKAGPRRFTGSPPTGFGGLSERGAR